MCTHALLHIEHVRVHTPACYQAALRSSHPLAACRSFLYSGGRRECRLGSADGEPRKFCKLEDFASYWRVELPVELPAELPTTVHPATAATDSATSDGAASVAAAGAAAGAAALPSRIVVQGRRLLDSRSGAEVVLHGVNIYLDYMRFDDTVLLRELLPGANLVRLVGVFWRDVEREEDCSCCTDDPAEGARRRYNRSLRPFGRDRSVACAVCIVGCVPSAL